MKDIKDAIKKIAETNDEIYSTVASVEKVDESKRTCNVKPLNGSAQIFNVRLQGDVNSSLGLVLLPKKDSIVIVTFINKDLAFVSLTTEITKILLNSSGFSADLSLIKSNFTATTLLELVAPQILIGGGIPLTGALSDQINGIKEDVNQLKGILGAWTPSSEGSLKAALAPYIAEPLELMIEPPAEENI